MSSGTTAILYRKFKGSIVSPVTIKTVRKYYEDEAKNRLTMRDEKVQEGCDACKDIDEPRFSLTDPKRSMDDPPSGMSLKDFEYIDMKDCKIMQKLLETSFNSSFTGLKHFWGLNAYKYKESTKVISKSEAKAIIQAIKYLLSGKYSKEMEDILSNEYIEVLGEEYPRYLNRGANRNGSIYIEKVGESYTATIGDPQADREDNEENKGQEYALKNLLDILSVYVSADDDSWTNTELLLAYEAW